MNDELKKAIGDDADGLKSYEYLANHIDSAHEVIDDIIENISRVDLTGQFVVSTARYLNAIDPERFSTEIDTLINLAIEKDREHRYLGDLLASIWGEDFASRAAELQATDNNFRRVYKRVYPQGF
ncbi:MAG: hypothetical protein K2M07_02500 [Muribaculaceae bacterium]|nr:hypothetical protein [Muribaculaceae bacterium]